MAGIAGEIAQRAQHLRKPRHEGVQRLDHPRQLGRDIATDRRQIIGGSRSQPLAQPVERPQRQRHRNPDDQIGAKDQPRQPDRRTQQDGTGQFAPRQRRFGDGHTERNGLDPAGDRPHQGQEPDRLTQERIIAIALAAGTGLRRRQRLIAGDKTQRPVDPVKNPILRGRAEHLQRRIGQIDQQSQILIDRHPLGDRQRRAAQHPVRDCGCGLFGLAPGVNQRHQTQNRGRRQQPGQ